MFTALRTPDDAIVVAIDQEWSTRVAELRQLAQSGRLLCQGCRQPVLLRAGEIYRWHFAHQHKGDCTFDSGDRMLEASRAVLYEYLNSKFPSKVTVEKMLKDIPRPVDCWVTRESGEPIGFWIHSRRLGAEARRGLKAALRQHTREVVWLFPASMIEREPSGWFRLSPMEREFAKITAVDSPLGLGSVHYIDPQSKQLTTVRQLESVHPQCFVGKIRVTPFESVLCLRRTGEFVHPDEEGDFVEVITRVQTAKRLVLNRTNTVPAYSARNPAPLDAATSVDNATSPTPERKYRCVFCGTMTPDSLCWTYSGQSGEGKCNSCRAKGHI